MLETICVYCSSSNRISLSYFDMADEVGRLLAQRGYTLLYGGGNVGLMGQMARAVHAHEGRVVGVIPERMKGREGVAYDMADELITTETMQQRKAILFTRADAFLVLPGGFGTLEEFMEVLTLRQLGYHDKPIALINTDGFYDPLLDLFDHFYREQFARAHARDSYYVTPDPEDALSYLERTVEKG